MLGATYARFLFAAPWAVLLVAVLALRGGSALPRADGGLRRLGAGRGGGADRGRRCCCCTSSRLRNFAVGNTFAKTETVQAALFGLVLLGDRVGALALAGILVSLVGLVLLSATRGSAAGR